jgi:DNA (cytosine-5)-methyltransferase 1
MLERLTADSESLSQPQELMPTPAVAHLRNHDEDLEAYQTRHQDFIDGKVKGMPGASLGVAVRMQKEGIDWKDDSSRLPTPTVSDLYTDNLASTQQKDGSLHSVTIAQVFHRTDLFPTPTTQDGKNSGGPSQFERNTLPLNAEVLMLPTPQVDDSKNTGHNQDRRTTLASEVWETERTTTWGKFEPAIRRWEQVIGRPAPEPTKPDGKDGNHRLSSEFTEWMMGVPKGWITDAGISRNEELKAAGNGVVPQQAELALRILLAQTDFINDIE